MDNKAENAEAQYQLLFLFLFFCYSMGISTKDQYQFYSLFSPINICSAAGVWLLFFYRRKILLRFKPRQHIGEITDSVDFKNDNCIIEKSAELDSLLLHSCHIATCWHQVLQCIQHNKIHKMNLWNQLSLELMRFFQLSL